VTNREQVPNKVESGVPAKARAPVL
jgi:hypothetical protein